MKVTCEIIYLFVFQEFLTNVIAAVEISSKKMKKNITRLECRITDTIQSVDCNILVDLDPIYVPIGKVFAGCYESDNNLKVVLSLASNFRGFECISDDPISIDFDFGNQKPLLQFTKFKTERISPEFSNSSSYKFKIKMTVPNGKTYLYDEGFFRFTYTIINLNHPTEVQNTKIRFLLLGSHEWMKGFINIEVTDEVVYLPCRIQERTLFFLEGFKPNVQKYCPDSLSKLNLSSDSSLVQWNGLEGLRVNLSGIWNRNGILLCVMTTLDKYPTTWRAGDVCMAFALQFPPNLQVFPDTLALGYPANLVESPTRLSTFNTRLICSSTETNVTMRLRFDKKIKASLKHYQVSQPEHRHVTEVEISNSQWKNLTPKSTFSVECVNSSNTTNILHSWTISIVDTYTQLIYDPTLEGFICSDVQTSDIKMLQIECDDISQCRMWDNYLRYKDGLAICNDQYITPIKGGQCDDKSIFGKQINFKSCRKYISTAKRAVVQCLEEFYADHPTITKELYFRGFDGITYTQFDVKTEAIVELKCLNEDGYFIFGQNITCSCEGHSFFHAHGIQWLVIFTNGSIQTFPKDIITYKKRPKTKDAYNPLSVVDIWFKFRNIKSIICAVPALNTKEWHNVTEHIQYIDGMPPKILSLEAEKAFSVGEKGQSLSCVSEGRPTPNVEWSQKNGPIEAPLSVSGQKNFKQLIFSDYNDTLDGEYVCTASNTFGNTTKSFKVSTKKESNSAFDMSSILILTISICLLIAILLIVYFIRRLRATQRLVAHLTESEIDDFFQGNENLQSTQSNPLALPYDMQYEMAKDSFEIDKKQILGSGEFGTVYKGSIHARGEFAFKTTRNICSPEGLKGMLSELKIMIYVGGHENIIKLIGAYTQEIKSGVLFIATEMCSMGSLHSHLRNIRAEITEKLDFLRSESYTKCLRWSEEIANGMDYLSLKHVIHSDLAARNILLTEREVVKISDFGLSRRMYNYVDYKKTDKSNPLPWKWMAIESLREMTFSTQSDVWAYGVTIWEIFSLGDVPFPGISWTIDFVKMLEQGLRNLKPDYATNELYKIMLSCWNKSPTDRPDFSSLRYFFVDYKIDDLNDETSDREDFYMDLSQ